jgi:hypothetical protein
VKYNAQGKALKRLDGLSGLAQVDAAHDRQYEFQQGEARWIVTFDRNWNLLGMVGDVQINDREAVALVTSFDQPGAMYRLPVNETTWQRVPIEADIRALALTPDGRLYIGTTTGMVQWVY